MGFFPLCFPSPEEYHRWRAARVNAGEDIPGYCHDCTPEYKALMLEEERCVHPEVQFIDVLSFDGGTERVGVRVRAKLSQP